MKYKLFQKGLQQKLSREPPDLTEPWPFMERRIWTVAFCGYLSGSGPSFWFPRVALRATPLMTLCPLRRGLPGWLHKFPANLFFFSLNTGLKGGVSDLLPPWKPNPPHPLHSPLPPAHWKDRLTTIERTRTWMPLPLSPHRPPPALCVHPPMPAWSISVIVLDTGWRLTWNWLYFVVWPVVQRPRVCFFGIWQVLFVIAESKSHRAICEWGRSLQVGLGVTHRIC